jgi:hypothetical protein
MADMQHDEPMSSDDVEAEDWTPALQCFSEHPMEWQHPADLGLDDHQLSVWHRVEQVVKCPLPKRWASHTCSTPPPPQLSHGASFAAAPSFLGAVPGCVFTTGSKGTGYYIDSASSLQPKTRSAAVTIQLDALVTSDPACCPSSQQEVGASLRRRQSCRRIRKANGCRRRGRHRAPPSEAPVSVDGALRQWQACSPRHPAESAGQDWCTLPFCSLPA